MPKRSSTPPSDPNLAAKSILAQITGEAKPAPEKNAAAVELGRRGGLKGGKARSEALSADERKRIAQAAAKARWGKESKK